ncbi:hypothetical protein [Lawsonibacter celer]|uniref:hypothetical protein n=1 Tax=Lawsonibacter celer TaxID=2986526 RepID=UPI0016480863|nr:hypothetical protein [Lawsonibacter celer]
MCIPAVIATLGAWFAGLFLDANLDFNPPGFLCLRVLFPLIVMGLFILQGSRRKNGGQ